MTPSPRFEFEDLQVWDKSKNLAKDIIVFLNNAKLDRPHYRLFEQLESAAASVPANITEGKGRFYKKELLKFLYYARGSLYETITFLQIFRDSSWIQEEKYYKLENQCTEVTRLLNGYISSFRRR